MEPLYKGHIGTLETVLYIEVVLNSEVIVQWNLSIKVGPSEVMVNFAMSHDRQWAEAGNMIIITPTRTSVSWILETFTS